MKSLIINADDFGMCHAVNEAVIELLEDNTITSATLMAPCSWFPEAAAYACTHPDKCVGVHLTFTSEWEQYRWGPVSRGPVASLLLDGYFPPDELSVEKLSIAEEVEGEIRAQIALAKAHGVNPSHLDNHMGSLYGMNGIQSHVPLVLRICAEMRLPFRFPKAYLPGDALAESVSEGVRAGVGFIAALAQGLGVPILDYLLAHPYGKLPGETYQSFRDSICEKLMGLPEGIHEMFIHPAKDHPELRVINAEWEKRVWEYQLFRDPQVRETLQKAGITTINWRDLAQLRAAEYSR